MKRARLTLLQRTRLLEDYERGIPIRAIADKYGVDLSYPSILAGRTGIPRRMPDAQREAMSFSHSKRRIQK